MKAPTACRQCRVSKRKCARQGFGEPCYSCVYRNLPCSSNTQKQSLCYNSVELHPGGDGHLNLHSVEGELDSPLLPDLSWGETAAFVEDYLLHVHGGAHSIFHPDTLRAQLRDRSIGKGLLNAICAIGSKFSPFPDRRAMAARLTAEAKRIVQADLENVCIENIQACILLAFLSAGNCQTSSEALFVRIATSMSEVMHLDSCPDSNSDIARETSRRIWWSLYIIDRWCFSGLGLPRHMDHVNKSHPLPMDELTFNSLTNDHTTLSISGQPGIFARMVLLVHQFGPIQDLNRSISRGCEDAVEVAQAVGRIEHRLQSWKENLPLDFQLTKQNLHKLQKNDLGASSVALHLTYHHFSTLLYFYFLERRQSANSTIYTYESRCKAHASSFSNLLHLSRQMRGCEPSYPTIGHMITVSSSVLLHTLLFGDIREIKKARQELNKNFEALLELQKLWPATEAMINRLIAFQNICLMSPESHRLDGWMVRFLLEQSLGLHKRNLPLVSCSIDIDSETKAKELTELGRYTDFTVFQSS